MTHPALFRVPAAAASLAVLAACSGTQPTAPDTTPPLRINVSPDSLVLVPGDGKHLSVRGGPSLCGASLRITGLPPGLQAQEITPPGQGGCSPRDLFLTADNTVVPGSIRPLVVVSKAGYRADSEAVTILVPSVAPLNFTVQVAPDSLILEPQEWKQVVIRLIPTSGPGWLPPTTVWFADLPAGARAVYDGTRSDSSRRVFWIAAGDSSTREPVHPRVTVTAAAESQTSPFTLRVTEASPGTPVSMDIGCMDLRDQGLPVAVRDGDGPWKLFPLEKVRLSSGRGAIAWKGSWGHMMVRTGLAQELNLSCSLPGGGLEPTQYGVWVKGVSSNQWTILALGNASGTGGGGLFGSGVMPVMSKASGRVDLLARTSIWGMADRYILRRNSPQPMDPMDFAGDEAFSLEQYPLTVSNSSPGETMELTDTLITDKARFMMAGGDVPAPWQWPVLPSGLRAPGDRYRLTLTASLSGSWRQVTQDFTSVGPASLALGPQPAFPDLNWTGMHGDLRLRLTRQAEYPDSISLSVVMPTDSYCDRDGGPETYQSVTILGGYAVGNGFVVEVPDFSLLPGFEFLAVTFPAQCAGLRQWTSTAWGRNLAAGWGAR